MLDGDCPSPLLDKSLVKASFERASSTYDKWADLQREIGERLLQFPAWLPSSPSTILDLGSGTGYCSRRLAQPDCCVIALDLARAMLTKARSLEQQETGYVCGDAESLPFREGCLDLVFSNLVIQWCTDLEKVFTEVYRVLNPGGIFLFSTFGPETLRELREAWQRVDTTMHVNGFAGRAAIREALSRSGFVSCDVRRQILRVEYFDVLELMRMLKGIGAQNINFGRSRALTGKDKLSRMIAEYRKINRDQTTSASFELILAFCRRAHGANGRT